MDIIAIPKKNINPKIRHSDGIEKAEISLPAYSFPARQLCLRRPGLKAKAPIT